MSRDAGTPTPQPDHETAKREAEGMEAMTPSNEALKPCGCGGEPKYVRPTHAHHTSWAVRCSNCRIETDAFLEQKTATEWWNRALSAPPPAVAPQGWQPIETAPKCEGSWILTMRAGGKIPMVASWDEEEGNWFTFNLAYEGQSRAIGERVWKPTHWMPLPTAPEKSNG